MLGNAFPNNPISGHPHSNPPLGPRTLKVIPLLGITLGSLILSWVIPPALQSASQRLGPGVQRPFFFPAPQLSPNPFSFSWSKGCVKDTRFMRNLNIKILARLFLDNFRDPQLGALLLTFGLPLLVRKELADQLDLSRSASASPDRAPCSSVE